MSKSCRHECNESCLVELVPFKAVSRGSVKRKLIDIHLLRLYQNAAGMLPNRSFISM